MLDDGMQQSDFISKTTKTQVNYQYIRFLHKTI